MIAPKDYHSSETRITLTDGGLETMLVFQEGIDLPEFAAFPLLDQDAGRKYLDDYFRSFLDIAAELGTGFILESPTWRANEDWGRKLGYSSSQLADINRRAIEHLSLLRREYEDRVENMHVSGCIGPRGDGYVCDSLMSIDESQSYHSAQVNAFAESGADHISAMTINYTEEAIGIVRAAKEAGMKSIISFTVETDGHLPSGQSLADAIEQTDSQGEGGPESYMINCAHPTHFADAISGGSDWKKRIQGIRANASRLSHAELDESETLDDGDPADLADRLRRLGEELPELNVFGGCCGTDQRHVQAIGRACVSL